MLRIQPIADAKAAESYYSKSDGGYYLQADDLGREWGGKGAATLGLSGPPDCEQFKRLIHGLDPHTGEQLTAKLVEHRIPAWDVNLYCFKGVTVALECGDSRIQEAFWESIREAMADIETLATTRVRKGGKQEDRVTGNLVWYAVEHPETQPAKEDKSKSRCQSRLELDFCIFAAAYAAGVSAVSRTSCKAFGNFAKATS